VRSRSPQPLLWQNTVISQVGWAIQQLSTDCLTLEKQPRRIFPERIQFHLNRDEIEMAQFNSDGSTVYARSRVKLDKQQAKQQLIALVTKLVGVWAKGRRGRMR
jgi:hypothetical protein